MAGSVCGVSDERRDPLEARREGSGWRRYALGIAALILAVFVIQNSQTVRVEFLLTQTDTPLIFALLFAGALGALIGWAAPKVRRDSKRD